MSSQIDLLEVLNKLHINDQDVKFRRKGKVAYIKCIFHSERNPSLRINSDLTYFCYGCHTNGSFRDPKHLKEVLDQIENKSSCNEQAEETENIPWE